MVSEVVFALASLALVPTLLHLLLLDKRSEAIFERDSGPCKVARPLILVAHWDRHAEIHEVVELEGLKATDLALCPQEELTLKYVLDDRVFSSFVVVPPASTLLFERLTIKVDLLVGWLSRDPVEFFGHTGKEAAQELLGVLLPKGPELGVLATQRGFQL